MMTLGAKKQDPGCEMKGIFHLEIHFQVADYISAAALLLNL